MYELSPTDEKRIEEFRFELAMIDGPDDMFPPDNLGGVREPRRPISPTDAEPNGIALAAVYDLIEVRKKREKILSRGSAAIREIELVLA